MIKILNKFQKLEILKSEIPSEDLLTEIIKLLKELQADSVLDNIAEKWNIDFSEYYDK
ncbi:MAG: hypothetical protein H7A31_03510 [Thermotogae bacterium]|nr:hypothetical protein [Thermotogota bacterium]MCP5465744.1 hypothetical protein [Thermotogota bacterium]